MAFLIPLLAPSIAEASANLAIGISNAVQGTSSSVSIQIGKKVFTNNKGFNLSGLPYELREKILLMALDESKSLVVPILKLTNPYGVTPQQYAALEKRSPLNRSNPNYRSVMNEYRSANGYPLSSWRWLRVCREWWALLRRELWKRCTIDGWNPYQVFLRLLESDDFHAAPFIRTLSLLDGFSSPSDLYTILTSPKMKHLETLNILPIYLESSAFNPYLPPPRPFPFGVHLIPVGTIRSVSIGLPLDQCTNQTTRRHLSSLQLDFLGVTLNRPSEQLFAELADLVGKTVQTISIRYLPDLTVPLRAFVDPGVLTGPSIRSFERVVITLPKITSFGRIPYQNQPEANELGERVAFSQRLIDLLDMDNEGPTVRVSGAGDRFEDKGDMNRDEQLESRGGLRNRTVVYLGRSHGDEEEHGLSTGRRIWPLTDEFAFEPIEKRPMMDKNKSGSRLSNGQCEGGNDEKDDKPDNTVESWERQTDLRLFGGLIGIRMESKKR
ncbi:hypothetical protein [Phaffia rhodozyma]|uniref:F-box domain-containing protein n=1 Tax=Phaffia rhodozyma TaxID=264483 RepID=A0A0F7SGN5_PHARH|nr:hypothetical protein [Phaffia rhodozyma]